MLVTSIFSFSHDDFYTSQNKLQFFGNISFVSFVACKCFQILKFCCLVKCQVRSNMTDNDFFFLKKTFQVFILQPKFKVFCLLSKYVENYLPLWNKLPFRLLTPSLSLWSNIFQIETNTRKSLARSQQ